MKSLRVMVYEIWNEFELPYDPSVRVIDAKRRALDCARIAEDSAAFVFKFRGAPVLDEELSLAAAGIPPGASAIVLRRARVPVR